MGKALVIPNADFSENALDVINLNSLDAVPKLGSLSSINGEPVASYSYCRTDEYYTGLEKIVVPVGYFLALRIYEMDGTYVNAGGISGMVNGEIDLSSYLNKKVRFLLTTSDNYPTETRRLTDNDLQDIYDAVKIYY